jgi:hypothetical protein
MRRFVKSRLLLVLATLWLAQVQGVVHEIGHLAAAAHSETSAFAPHANYCAECLVLAQTGAALLHAPPQVHAAEPASADFLRDVGGLLACPGVLAYRSRAPPQSPV